eukprot:COSAG02_NODE_1061_length_14864_cov_7.878090_8_plen_286_part_00
MIAGLASNGVLLGVARSLLDMHVRIAAAQQVGEIDAGLGCAFPHAVGHAMGWVEAPFPPARMGLSALAVMYQPSNLASAHRNDCHQAVTTAAYAAAIMDIAVGSHHAQRSPISSTTTDSQHKATTLTLRPGEIVLLDTRTWRRYRSCRNCTLIEIVLCPWWISCEFPRDGRHSTKHNFGCVQWHPCLLVFSFEQKYIIDFRLERPSHSCSKYSIVRGARLAATTIQDWPKEVQELVRHMSEEDGSWQNLKAAETTRAIEYAKRKYRQGTNNGVIVDELGATQAKL